jgi:hypothetical protein
MKLSVNIFLTTSKMAAYIILAIGTVFAFVFKDGYTLLATFSAVSAILITKTYTQSRTTQKQIECKKKEDEIG